MGSGPQLMCGIFGYFDRTGHSIPTDLVEQMGYVIRHRGPDGHGVATSPGCAVGNMRLAIIDLATGQQPMVSDCGKVSVVQNGEIYNYLELQAELRSQGVQVRTNSDTEVLLHLYLLHGKDFVHKLNGMFSVAVSDQRNGTLLVARDPLGVKPLLFSDQDGCLLFGSEIKSILRAGFPRKLDIEALHHFMSYGYVPPPWTLFQGIRHLMPGHLLIASERGVQIEQWWDISQQQQEAITQDKFTEQFLSLLDTSVQMRMRADVPFGAFLSGGLDSSTVVGLMNKHTRHAIKTFSIGFHDPRFDESKFGEEASQRFGTDHHLDFVGPEIVKQWARVTYHCDQPHSDVSFMPTWRLSQLAVQHVKMVLTGDGGDELFGGYEKFTKYFGSHGTDESSDDFAKNYHNHIVLFNEADKRTLYSDSLLSATAGMDTQSVTASHLNKVPHWDRMNQALWLDVSLLLPGNNLVKPDRMAMASSLEARDPFLDKALTEFAFRVRGDFKIQNGETRYAYKRAVEPLLGHNLTYRDKRMFTVPIGEWFRDVLRDQTHAMLTSEQFLDRGLFNRERVAQVLHDHENGRDQTRQIRQLIALELWHRIFLDSEELDADKAASQMDVDQVST